MALPLLSPTTQEFFETMDIDGEYHRWQIPLVHLPKFDELVQKGYLVRGERSVMAADGQHEGKREVLRFADELTAARDGEMYR